MEKLKQLEQSIKVPEPVIKILDILSSVNHTGYIVGGSIRDSVMGLDVHDWDMGVDLEPEGVLELYTKYGYRVIPTGLKHGTVSIIPPEPKNSTDITETMFELTTFRVDGKYSDGRHPKSVTYTRNLLDDLGRRDFTINAIAYNPKTGLVDPYDGILDIEKKVIRAVGNPIERFNEDALRILRALRFSSKLEFKIDKNTSFAIHSLKNNLSYISKERIFKELIGILRGKNAKNILIEYSDVLSVVIPQIEDMVKCTQNNKYHYGTVWEHTCDTIDNAHKLTEFPKDWVDDEVLMALLLHDIGKPSSKFLGDDGYEHFYGHASFSGDIAEKVLSELKVSNKFKETVVELVYNHDISFEPTRRQARRYLSKFGLEQLQRLLKMRECDNRAHTKEAFPLFQKSLNFFKYMVEESENMNKFSIKDLAIDGNDIKSMGYKEGPEIGKVLREIYQKVLDGEVGNDVLSLKNYIESNFQPSK